MLAKTLIIKLYHVSGLDKNQYVFLPGPIWTLIYDCNVSYQNKGKSNIFWKCSLNWWVGSLDLNVIRIVTRLTFDVFNHLKNTQKSIFNKENLKWQEQFLEWSKQLVCLSMKSVTTKLAPTNINLKRCWIGLQKISSHKNSGSNQAAWWPNLAHILVIFMVHSR